MHNVKLNIAHELRRSFQSVKETSKDLFKAIREGVREAQKDYRLRVAYEKGEITIADLEKKLDNKEINFEDLYQLAETTSKDRKALIDLLARKRWEELRAMARAAGIVISFVPGVGDLYEIFEAISKYCGSRELTLGESLFVIGTILLPGAAGGVVKNVGKAVQKALENYGQLHHILSQRIIRQLSKHETLGGLQFSRNVEKFLHRFKELSSHKGYQTWHRKFDDEIVNWLKNHPKATPAQFEQYILQTFQKYIEKEGLK